MAPPRIEVVMLLPMWDGEKAIYRIPPKTSRPWHPTHTVWAFWHMESNNACRVVSDWIRL